MTKRNDSPDRVIVAASAVAVVLLAGATLAPLWAPLAFAAWTAALLDPFATWLAKKSGGRRWLGAGAATVMVLALLVPVGLTLTSIASSVAAFVRQMMASPQARSALEAVVSPEAGATTSAPSEGIMDLLRANITRLPTLAREHGATAWSAASSAAGAGAIAALTVFIFFVALYSFLEDGREMWAWAKRHAPLREAHCDRLGRAFLETGHGLMVGAGLTGLAQAVLATVIYAALGVPRFMVLGAITFVCAFIPTIGTAIVWAPIAIGFFLKGSFVKGLLLVLLGGVGIGSIDNVLRPFMQRWGGNMKLSSFVLLLAAFGGLAAFGAKGLILGPLSIRLCVEVLAMARENREAQQSARGMTSEPEPHETP
jgi:predicted PurR-regulated permease PerM